MSATTFGGTVTYTGTAASGNWFGGGNWSNSTNPGFGDDALIEGITSGSLTVNLNGMYSGSGLNSLTIDNQGPFGSASTLSQAAGSGMQAVDEFIGVTSGRNIYSQSGGTNVVTDDLDLGSTTYSASQGQYLLSGGSLSVADYEYVGLSTDMHGFDNLFDQTGGTNSCGTLVIGHFGVSYGHYLFSNGSLNAATIIVGEATSATVNSLSQSGTAVTTVTSLLILGDGSHGDSGGTFSLDGGTVAMNNSSNMEIGDGGTGVLNQTAGNVTFSSSGGILELGLGNAGVGSYYLSGAGVLSGASTEYVGYASLGGVTTGAFYQSGGTNAVAEGGSLTVGYYTNGTYNLTNGNVSATNVSVGPNYASGVFNQSGGTVASDGVVTIGKSGTYSLTGGSLNASGGGIDLAINGTGTFTQTGGVANLVGQVAVGESGTGVATLSVTNTGQFNCSGIYVGFGGSGQLNLTGGTLNAKYYELIGYTTPGAFTQNTGVNNAQTLGIGFSAAGIYSLMTGTLNVSQTETINSQGSFVQTGGNNLTPSLLVGTNYTDAGTAAYTLYSGYLTVSGNASVGATGPGLFTQTYGFVSVAGTLYVAQGASAPGSYVLSGPGTITAGAEQLGVVGTTLPGGGANFVQGGVATFLQSGGTNTVTGTDTNNFSFDIYYGSSYTLNGGTLNLPTVAGAAVNNGLFVLGGTGNLTGILNNLAPVGYNLSNQPSSGFIMTGGTIASGATVQNFGGISVSGGTIAGTVINTVTGTVNQNGGNFSGTLLNSGVYNLTAGTFSGTPIIGTGVNSAGGYFNLLPGGTINVPTFTNQGTFTYTGGTFTGRLVNLGFASIGGLGRAISNGIENDSALMIGPAGVTTLNVGGTGLDNIGTATLYDGSTLTGTILNDYGGNFTTTGSSTIVGTLTNAGTLQPSILGVTGMVSNSGMIALGYNQLLNAQGGVTNTGYLIVQAGRLTGGSIVNNPGGQIIFSSSGGEYQISNPATHGFSQSISNPGGVIIINSLNQATFSSFAAGNTAGGDIQIADNAALASNTSFPNSGTIELAGNGSALSGGAITNTGSISGIGRVSNQVLNGGTLEASGGKLTLSGSGDTNATGAQITADAASTIQYSQGLATNAGTITLVGGTFDNNSRALSNTGIINGSGAFKTGGSGLNNTTGALIDVTAGTSFYGPVTNTGAIIVHGSTTTFYGNVTEPAGGTIKITNGTVYFLGNTGASVGGLYTSDPSDNYFNGLSVTPSGTVLGGDHDRFFLLSTTAMTNAGTFDNTGTLSATTVANSGTLSQTGTLVETGNFTNSGTVTIGGTQNWSHGTVFSNTAGTATFLTDAGSTGENLSVTLTGGSVTFASTQHLASLNIGSGTTAQIIGGGNTHRSMMYTPSLSSTGTLDLTGNDLDLQNGGPAALAALTARVAQGYSNGTWTGNGITSSSAAADASHLTAVGLMLNTAYTSLDGAAVAANDVLAKETYYGDANLDGKIDGSDYSRIDVAFHADQSNPQASTGWYNGDFNYDGTVNGSDYTLMDNAFNTQTAVLSAEIATPTAQLAGIAGTSAVPEPATLASVGIGSLAVLSRRRIRKA